MANEEAESPYKTFTAFQRMLRYIGVIFFCWSAFTLVINAVLPAVGVVLGMTGEAGEASTFVGLVLFACVTCFNFAFSIGMWYAGNHPRCARAFRCVAVALLVLNIVPVVTAVLDRQFTGVVSGAYNLAVMGLIVWLATGVEREFGEGIAVDREDLPRTVGGKRLRTERALERAMRSGTLAEQSAASREA